MRSLLLDTNLCILLLVGLANGGKSVRHKRLGAYSLRDFKLLKDVVRDFDTVYITSYCLAEVSNLLRTGERGDRGERLMKLLADLVDKGFVEVQQTLKRLSEEHHEAYLKLGLPDAGIIAAASEASSILTDDLDLFMALTQRFPLKAANFNHLRQQ